MDRIALFTTSFGGIDSLKPIPSHARIDTYFITDCQRPDQKAAASWTRVLEPAPASATMPLRTKARYHKTQIHRLEQARSYRWLAWADAAFLFYDISFVASAATALEELAPNRRLALIPHPHRKTVNEEYEFIRTEIESGSTYLRVRYRLEELAAQMAFLANAEMRSDGKLWASGFFLVENSEQNNACWDSWWEQIQRFGAMDQLSLAPLIERFCLLPVALNLDIFDNLHFRWVAHKPIENFFEAIPSSRLR